MRNPAGTDMIGIVAQVILIGDSTLPTTLEAGREAHPLCATGSLSTQLNLQNSHFLFKMQGHSVTVV